jgi:hypothetical protein
MIPRTLLQCSLKRSLQDAARSSDFSDFSELAKVRGTPPPAGARVDLGIRGSSYITEAEEEEKDKLSFSPLINDPAGPGQKVTDVP